MKKFVSILLLLAMVLSLCACGSDTQPAAPTAEPSAEPVAEAQPDYEALSAEAAELFFAADYDGAFAALSELEDCGIPQVSGLLALCHYYGYGTEIDAEAAVELLEPLAAGGDCFAGYLLAKATVSGEGTVQNPDAANELFADFVSAAEKLNADDSFSGLTSCALADCYVNALGTVADKDKAFSAARDAAESGKLPALQMFELAAAVSSAARDIKDPAEAKMNELGLDLEAFMLRLEDMKRDEEIFKAEIADYEKLLAELALADEQLALAKELSSGAKDAVQALADEGNIYAMKLMGDYYFGALGSDAPDYSKAYEYYMLAADEDYAPAQAQLGLMYQEGHGVELSYEQAMEWNNRAAQQGNAQGQAQIGYLYHMGLGVTQNLDEAGRWYSRAAEQGDSWAASKLAETELTNPHLAFEFHA